MKELRVELLPSASLLVYKVVQSSHSLPAV